MLDLFRSNYYSLRLADGRALRDPCSNYYDGSVKRALDDPDRRAHVSTNTCSLAISNAGLK